MKCLSSVLLVAVIVLPNRSEGQLAYRTHNDTIIYESANEYRMYFVRGIDTLGQPIATRTIERHSTRAARGQIELLVATEGVEQPFQAQNTYEVTPRGQVLRVDGRPVAEVPNARVDVLPRFPGPATPPVVGLRWVDSVFVADTQSYGPTYYRVRREYRLQRLIDTLSTQLALITSGGEMALRHGGWEDSSAGVLWWQEVKGPVTDTIWFDVRRGIVHSDAAHMVLSGSGGGGPKKSVVTMPSGLRSSVRRVRRGSS